METISPWNIVQSELQSSVSEPPLLGTALQKKVIYWKTVPKLFLKNISYLFTRIAQTKLSLASEAEAKQQKKE